MSGGQEILTNKDEANGDDVGQDVASERFIILPITFTKEADEGVEIVLTQTLSIKI